MDKLRRIPIYGVYGLLIYMPFHVFLSQSLSLLTGGLTVWKVAKDALTAILVAIIVFMVWSRHKPTPVFKPYFLLPIFYLLIHLLVWAFNRHIFTQSAILGTVYNTRLLGYLLIGLGAGLMWPKKFEPSKVIRVVITVSTIVCLLGVIQYFLPKDILSQVGYSPARGVKPAFFIDDKPDLPRIMSTLRDPNSLGAYLVLPITLLAYELFNAKNRKRMMWLGLFGLHGLALLLTFSRSAWVGATLSLGILGFFQFRRQIKPWLWRYWPALVGSILLIGSLTFTVRNQYAVQNILVHADKSTATKSKLDSNGYHLEFAKRGLVGIWHKPLGHGPGTAGLVSIKNPDGGLLTENYYLQIGYEIGILGLLLFIIINVLVYKQLKAHSSQLTAVLLASFWAYVLINMLLHIWSNEAVAIQWWLLAGLAIGLSMPGKKRSQLA